MAGTKRGPMAAGAAALVASVLAFPPSAWGGFSAVDYEIGPIRIPDGHGSARLSFDFTAGSTDLVTAIRPNFRVNHRQTRQLKLLVKGPDGSKVLLSKHETHGRKLGSQPCAPDFNDLSFTGFWDAGANGPIATGAPPYAGYFVPHAPLTGFNGQTFDGTWRVIVKDTKKGKRGRLLCGLMSVFYE